MIVGFNIDSLNANKEKGVPKGDLQINYSPKIKSVKKTGVNAFDGKVAKVEFSFTVSYDIQNRSVGKIEFNGNILWKGNPDELEQYWNENQELPDNVKVPLMNDLYRKCISQAVGVSDTLGLLPPIPTPRIEQ